MMSPATSNPSVTVEDAIRRFLVEESSKWTQRTSKTIVEHVNERHPAQRTTIRNVLSMMVSAGSVETETHPEKQNKKLYWISDDGD